MRLKSSKMQNKEPEIIEISSDDDNNNESNAENSDNTNAKSTRNTKTKDSSNTSQSHVIDAKGNKKVASNEISIITFEPWHVLSTDVQKVDFSDLDQRLPNNDFQFNLPFHFMRFGTLEYQNGCADFITNKGISIVVKGSFDFQTDQNQYNFQVLEI
jgi:hypothetical protein